MLKIKNDVDLKELEKYGYKDYGYSYIKCVMRDKKIFIVGKKLL